VVDAEQEVGNFLKEENRELLNGISEKSLSTTKFSLNISEQFHTFFTSLSNDLETKINSENSTNKINQMKKVKMGLEDEKIIAGISDSVLQIVDEYANDETKLSQIKAAIQKNQAALQELADFEKTLLTQCMPFVDEMLQFSQQFESNLTDQSSIMLEFNKLDVQKMARKLMSMIQIFTKDFKTEKNEFADIFTDLVEFLATVIEVYDKINELEYRSELVHFLGQIHGGQCADSQTSDSNACKTYLNTSATIESNEIVREFLQIFTAYQLALFPYGGAKMQVLQSTLALFNHPVQLSTQQKVLILRSALETIKSDLSDINNKITNHKDKNVMLGSFNSRYTSSKPFYIWPNSKFSNQIKALLKGDEVTLVASVLAPGVRNAVKFQTVMLNITSSDAAVAKEVQNLLNHFQIEIFHKGESYYKCGSTFYSIAGEGLNFKASFERDEKGNFVFSNKVVESLKIGEVPLSPYTIWKFQLFHSSAHDRFDLFEQLSRLADRVDLELIGTGSYLDDKAPICNSDLGEYYNYFETLF